MADRGFGAGGEGDHRPITVDYRGSRHILGRTDDGYALWRTEGGPVIRTFPQTTEGWAEAWRAYRELEAERGFVPTSQWRRGRPIPLREMRVGQVLDGAFRLYRMYFGRLVPAVALVLVPFAALTLALQLGTGRTVVVPGPQGTISFFEPAPWVPWVLNPIRFLVVTPFLTVAVVAMASDAYLGRPVTVGGAYRRALPKIHSILWVSILTGLAVAGVMLPAILLAVAAAVGLEPGLVAAAVILGLLLLVPAIFLVIRFLYGAALVVVEDRRGTDALRRSWRLVKGLGGKVLGTMILAILILFAFQMVIGIIVGVIFFASMTPGGFEIGRGFIASATMLGVGAEILTLPFVNLVVVLLYFDARIRKEGFDLEVMAQQLGGPPPAGA